MYKKQKYINVGTIFLIYQNIADIMVMISNIKHDLV